MRTPEILVIILHPLHTRIELSPLYLPLPALRQPKLLLAAIPVGKQDRDEHDTRGIGEVWHSSMPQADIADDQRALRQAWLDRGTDPPALLDQRIGDMLVVRSIIRKHVAPDVVVCAEPDFRGAISGRGRDQVDINAKAHRQAAEIAVQIDVHRLACRGFEGRVGAVETHTRVGPHHAFKDGRRPRVGDHVVEYVPLLGRRLLLDVACLRTEVDVRCLEAIELPRIDDHACVELVQVSWIHCVFEDDQAVHVQGLESGLEVM